MILMIEDAHGLSRWRFHDGCYNDRVRLARCHALAPWSFTWLVWRHGQSAVGSKRDPPRGKPVASLARDFVLCNSERDPPLG